MWEGVWSLHAPQRLHMSWLALSGEQSPIWETTESPHLIRIGDTPSTLEIPRDLGTLYQMLQLLLSHRELQEF